MNLDVHEENRKYILTRVPKKFRSRYSAIIKKCEPCFYIGLISEGYKILLLIDDVGRLLTGSEWKYLYCFDRSNTETYRNLKYIYQAINKLRRQGYCISRFPICKSDIRKDICEEEDVNEIGISIGESNLFPRLSEVAKITLQYGYLEDVCDIRCTSFPVFFAYNSFNKDSFLGISIHEALELGLFKRSAGFLAIDKILECFPNMRIYDYYNEIAEVELPTYVCKKETIDWDLLNNWSKMHGFAKGAEKEDIADYYFSEVLSYSAITRENFPINFIYRRLLDEELDSNSGTWAHRELLSKIIHSKYWRRIDRQFLYDNWIDASDPREAELMFNKYQCMIKDFIRIVGEAKLTEILLDISWDDIISTSGWPDFLFHHKENGMLFVEVKFPKDKLQDNQKRWLTINRNKWHFPAAIFSVE